LRCATNSASSLVRIGAFVQLTGCFGYFCDGCGLGGGKRSCWCTQSPSIAGIVTDWLGVGAAAHGALDDPGSI